MSHPCVVLRDIRFHIHPQGDKRLEYKKLNESRLKLLPKIVIKKFNIN